MKNGEQTWFMATGVGLIVALLVLIGMAMLSLVGLSSSTAKIDTIDQNISSMRTL